MADIGIFGGTFDPIHYGHLNLAVGMLKEHSLDEIWFCPVQISPHKQNSPPTPSIHRLAMLKLALRDYPQFKITDVEINRKGPSYTIDTIRDLKKSYPEHKFSLIMSDEVLPSFAKWHQPEKIINEVPFLVASRVGADAPTLPDYPELEAAVRKGWTPLPVTEVSATEIRNRINKNLDIERLVPEKVLDYIRSNQLYLLA